MRTWVRGGLTAVLVSGICAGHLAAQSVTVAAGASSYVLSGRGTSWVASARVDGRDGSPFRWQAGLGAFSYRSEFGSDITLVMPEAGVSWHPSATVPFYLGAGGGFVYASRPESTDVTLYTAAGMDVSVGRSWGVRPEMRIRFIDPWARSMVDFTLGVRRSFSPI